MAIVAHIFDFASSWLTDGGRLSLILPYDARISSLRTAASFGFHPFRTIMIRTVETKPPNRVILELSRHDIADSQEFITLMKDGGRSPEYSLLTQGFYLDSSQK